MKYLLIGTLLFSLSVFACSKDGKSGIAPENDMLIPAYIKTDSPITKESFFRILNEVERVYMPIMNQFGDELEVIKDWNIPFVNAIAYDCVPGSPPRFKNKKLNDCSKLNNNVIYMFGGLARHPSMNEDALTLVACHEIGHHIGGSPKITGLTGTSWASNEGQSDYWATLKCARKVWENDDNASIIANMEIPEVVKIQCEQFHESNNDISLCMRSAMAGKALATTLSEIKAGDNFPPQAELVKKKPEFETPSKRLKRSTDHNHPKAQCRLDTYFMGATCGISHTDNVDQEDPNIGVCSRFSAQARRLLAGKKGKGGGSVEKSVPGTRPRCWYKPTQRTNR